MDREILFRGKHIHALLGNEHLDGRWIEGYLADKNHINSPELEGEFLVDPETVCQYTGLTDKKGRKIFEGDIIRYEKKLYVVKWIDGIASFSAKPLDECRYTPCMNEGTMKCSEIIGNIFDNPELLEGGAE